MTVESDTDPIDLPQLRRQTLGDDALMREVLEMFRANCADQRHLLATTGDADTWKRTAHSLKGSARTIGASRCAAIAETLERLAWPPSADLRAHHLAALDEALSAVLARISSIFAR